MAKTVENLVNIKELSFEERVKGYENAVKILIEKWGVSPWAGLQSNNEMIAAVPMLKDLWPKETPDA